MKVIHQHIHSQRNRYLRQFCVKTVLRVLFYGFLLWILTGTTALLFPAAIGRLFQLSLLLSFGLLLWFFYLLISKYRFVIKPGNMASLIEQSNPELGLKLRTALEFLNTQKLHTQEQASRHTDHREALAPTTVETQYMQDAYIGEVAGFVRHIPDIAVDYSAWGVKCLISCLIFCLFSMVTRNQFQSLLQGDELILGSGLITLHGSLTIFEPDYTGIPGRTLPLSEGTFEAYPGSRVRLHFEELNARETYQVELKQGEGTKKAALKKGSASSYEFLLEQPCTLVLQKTGSNPGESQELIFSTKEDRIPEIQILNHTPEGEIEPRRPFLFLESVCKDDFGLDHLDLVVQWKTVATQESELHGEKRIRIPIRPEKSRLFKSRNQWPVSDLVPEDVDSFSVYLEAVDDNPFNGPGVGQSQTLYYGITSPEKQREKFMDMVRELLDAMTFTLADNLDTSFSNLDRHTLIKARDLSNSIQGGLLHSKELVELMIIQLRQQSMSQTLDRDFLQKFRSRLRNVLNDRKSLSQIYAQLHYANQLEIRPFNKLKTGTQREEVKLENLVYDLLLQVKLWALMDMEQNQANMEETLSELEQLLENSENMEMDELKKELDKLMDELMKEMSEMMKKAAEEMDLSMEEFMNQEAMQNNQQEISDLKKQLEEALKNGDIQKAKEILEAMKQAMQAMMDSMKQSIGEMSPEMKAMMKAMQELMGLIGALKEGEEQLESDTQELMRKTDQEIADQLPSLDEELKQEFMEIIEKIRQIMNKLHTGLSSKRSTQWMEPMLDRLGELNTKVQNAEGESELLRREILQIERDLLFLSRNRLDLILNMIITSLKELDLLEEFLKNFEFQDALENAFNLKNKFYKGKTVSQFELPKNIEQETSSSKSFERADEEIQKIIDFLEQLQAKRDQLRSQHLQQNSGDQTRKLSERQFDLQDLIPEFMQQYEEDLKSMPMMDQLKSIQRDMQQAGDRLGKNRLNPGLKHEQDALRKLGELQEQMMQMQQGQGKGMMPRLRLPGHRQLGQMGDPTGDLFIPDSEKKARKSEIKDKIRKNMQKNLPRSHSKEIKAYYERLMGQ